MSFNEHQIRVIDLVIAKEMRNELRDSVSKAQGLHKMFHLEEMNATKH